MVPIYFPNRFNTLLLLGSIATKPGANRANNSTPIIIMDSLITALSKVVDRAMMTSKKS